MERMDVREGLSCDGDERTKWFLLTTVRNSAQMKRYAKRDMCWCRCV